MAALAVNGGRPVRTKPFPAWPVRNDKEMQKLREVWESGKWGINSPYIVEFEKEFARFHGVKYGLSAVNGTATLWIGLRACGVGLGDEVIIPPYTFVATATCVLLANAVPVFVDIDPDTYNIDTNKIEEAITERTKAIIPVHIGGLPCDMDKIMEIARKHDLKVIEDAAQAHCAEWKGRKVGTIGDLGSFSFQMSKNITSGEGGALITDDKDLIDKCFSFQNCGRVRSGLWYQHYVLGPNNRMTAFQAAVLSAQLEIAQELADRRDANGRYLDQELSKIFGIKPQKREGRVTKHAYHLYIFRYDINEFGGLSRRQFIDALNAEGIPCSPGYVPLYKEEVFATCSREFPWLAQRTDYNKVSLPVCEKACSNEGVWLTQNMLLGEREDMDAIVEAVTKVREGCGEILGGSSDRD
jgi:dTDP-4-amino-4,6-dideoxygalactose transaminase